MTPDPWEFVVVAFVIVECVVLFAFLVGPVLDRIPGMRFVGTVWDHLVRAVERALTAAMLVLSRLLRRRS